MTEDDDAFLKSYNSKHAAASQLSEDEFESIMDVFEDTASISTPFAAVDKTVVPYDMMVQGLQQLESAKVMSHAKEIYEYWKSQREQKGAALHPSLKFETHQETDEMDPYVCFRRREVRQTRKTRARDVQSADKLKRLRRELEDGRQLIILSHERELLKRDILQTDRAIFEHRAKLKEAKIRLGIKTDDDDLIHTKVSNSRIRRTANLALTVLQPQKRKAPELPMVQRPSGPQLRMPVRSDGRNAEADLAQLRDVLAEKENEMRAEIENKISNHRRWNAHHVDCTRDPLGPVKGQTPEVSFRPATTQYLMTPPASIESGSQGEPEPMELDEAAPGSVIQFRGVAQGDDSPGPHPSYRRRIGRLNRLWIDRRGLASPPQESSLTDYSDRWKYDQDDSDDEQPLYEIDPFDTRALKFRASIPIYTRRPEVLANGVAHVNGVGPPGRPALPQPPPSQAVS